MTYLDSMLQPAFFGLRALEEHSKSRKPSEGILDAPLLYWFFFLCPQKVLIPAVQLQRGRSRRLNECGVETALT